MSVRGETWFYPWITYSWMGNPALLTSSLRWKSLSPPQNKPSCSEVTAAATQVSVFTGETKKVTNLWISTDAKHRRRSEKSDETKQTNKICISGETKCLTGKENVQEHFTEQRLCKVQTLKPSVVVKVSSLFTSLHIKSNCSSLFNWWTLVCTCKWFNTARKITLRTLLKDGGNIQTFTRPAHFHSFQTSKTWM